MLSCRGGESVEHATNPKECAGGHEAGGKTTGTPHIDLVANMSGERHKTIGRRTKSQYFEMNAFEQEESANNLQADQILARKGKNAQTFEVGLSRLCVPKIGNILKNQRRKPLGNNVHHN